MYRGFFSKTRCRRGMYIHAVFVAGDEGIFRFTSSIFLVFRFDFVFGFSSIVAVVAVVAVAVPMIDTCCS